MSSVASGLQQAMQSFTQVCSLACCLHIHVVHVQQTFIHYDVMGGGPGGKMGAQENTSKQAGSYVLYKKMSTKNMLSLILVP